MVLLNSVGHEGRLVEPHRLAARSRVTGCGLQQKRLELQAHQPGAGRNCAALSAARGMLSGRWNRYTMSNADQSAPTYRRDGRVPKGNAVRPARTAASCAPEPCKRAAGYAPCKARKPAPVPQPASKMWAPSGSGACCARACKAPRGVGNRGASRQALIGYISNSTPSATSQAQPGWLPHPKQASTKPPTAENQRRSKACATRLHPKGWPQRPRRWPLPSRW